jgi:hypothetical protein
MNRRISVNTGLAVPQSFITKGKQRLKQHIDTVYLKNGDEFEIELFNPTQNKVLAKIEVNGNSICSGGIILRPGERIFLERYIDEPKRFLFETYVVNGNNEEVQNAIARNGNVTIKFHKEIFLTSNKPYYSNSGTLTVNPYVWTTTNTPTWNQNWNQNLTYTSTSNNLTFNSNSTLTNGVSTNTFYNKNIEQHDGVPCSNNVNINGDNSLYIKTATSPLRHVETGRVEKGSDSNQTFVFDNSQFNSYPSNTDFWKIKPSSNKPVVKEELVTYCAECGAKRKKDTHKFCPHCGTKF